MNNSITRTARRALLPALAVAALFAALPAAQADQQITNAQIDNALNWGASSGVPDTGAYAQAIRPYHGHVRHYR
ncbi:MAG TPA: hypothetical protein VKX28_22920 [Xanthobacteraceae bacterium]|nr:hypothetical protein [Xanthobacteraceae bacterium]